jgi:Family of unknown function (DUF6496)
LQTIESRRKEDSMPETRTLKRARKARRQGKSPSSQAGEFVREEIHHVREGKHGARSTKQAIAIGLSKARRAGVKLGVPKRASARTKQSARSASAHAGEKPSPRRSRAVLGALKRERHSAASHDALARQARSSARKRGPKARRRAAQRAARTRKRRG